MGLLIWLAFRGWSVLLLASWTQIFMGSAARFLQQVHERQRLGHGDR